MKGEVVRIDRKGFESEVEDEGQGRESFGTLVM